MKFWEKLGNIDRRVIYVIMAIVVIVPLILTVKLPSKVRAMPRTKSIFNHVEQIDPTAKRKALILSIDFDPQSEPELKPQFEAVVRHAFAKDIPVLVLALNIQGTDIGREVLERLAAEHNQVYGEDYVLLGWKPSVIAVILGMGNFINQVFPEDYYGTPLDSLPVMKEVINYDDAGMVMNFTASSFYSSWVIYAHTPFNVPTATGVTSVSVADIYPYLGSKQLLGMLAGMKAAGEYERLVKDRYYPNMTVKKLAKDSYEIIIEEQVYDADSIDLQSLAKRFNLNAIDIQKAITAKKKFERNLTLLQLPETDSTFFTYSRELTVTPKNSGTIIAEVSLAGQKLKINETQMQEIAKLYYVSGEELHDFFKKSKGDSTTVSTKRAKVKIPFLKSIKKLKKSKSSPAKFERKIFLRGTQALPALSASLIVIILFVIIGNISFFASRRKK